ncbi:MULTISPECIES: homoserine dehydrogenase [unclassified Gordonia (in: high G+C Gram-positive bacteria)]|uniref:homoserine dehydrogenase n=1 Tax=Gordonia TaxID=2053 RepID=UPI00071C50D1|nr:MULTISPECIES: homoserine dehydrogenase [unclassified Gordonia (in: high G+C Gram-positive bacteria)]OCW88044.1 homoserine dehydrogenase [Nocardia farcinica]MBR7190562.1 homoserine dehydrogenase [Gordonia sp. SCSIO 19800]MCX2756243.1 homoserine dehydrogenase [Gordonia sp. 4N]MDT0220238.1 homoserine dehydrogenase [Gordonia sp. AC31]OCH78866.1 homoserine dehydrogenase [Gordonia sp. UCD-TK1]
MTESVQNTSGATDADSRTIGVAVLGMGNVGAEVVRIITDNADDLRARVGAPVEIRGVAVRDLGRPRKIAQDLLTDDPAALVARDDVDIVVELMGGIDPARGLIRSALESGKSVVTANKALLAEYTGELATAAADAKVDLYFEAAVAGAIPVIRPLMQSLAGDTVERVNGIVNGTTNFILSAMDETGADYADTLAEAGRLGYAEADPTADVEGYDAAAKAAILASIAFHTRVTAADVHREGISSVTSADLVAAKKFDCTIKLLSICERVRDANGAQRISARVYPALIPLTHPLATVNGAFNAVVVEAENAGRLMFYGQGAGGSPTASAVLGDMVMAARNRVHGGRGPLESTYASLPVAPIDDVFTRYYVSMRVADKPGVLAQVAGEFSKRSVSIAAVRQEGAGDDARLILVTHRAPDRAQSDCVAALEDMDAVIKVSSVLRLEGTDD